MNRRLLRIQLLSLAFATLMVIGYVPQAVWAGQMMEQDKELFPKPFEGYDLDSIYIFYALAEPHISMGEKGFNSERFA